MRVTIKYFASLREALNQTEESIDLPFDVVTTGQLRAYLSNRGPIWSHSLGASRSIQVALNQELVTWETSLVDKAEIALFPPVTGG